MKKAQLSIEFFLIASFIIALAAIMVTTAESNLRSAEALDKAALGKAALDAATGAINLAAVGGNGAQSSATVFIPQSTACFILDKNNGEPRMQCDADPSLEKRVSGRALYSPDLKIDDSCPPSNTRTGWFRVIARNVDGKVQVRCEERN
ncbi:hypothetical protein HY995_05300 [Candidatus Micrarchaeota archaeon]|nr:hypothetical protein [Candidatus Micrarchaeota archaeon]MBI5177471.1 hypothetical protein [Candidatus Micrarchaeota archaeon]